MKSARKFRRNTPITKSQKKRDELATNILILQQLILHRAANIVDQFIAASAATKCDAKEMEK